jgi:predicted hydrolase (HD superfamily)
MLDVDYEYMQKYLEEHNDELLDVLSEKNVTGTEKLLRLYGLSGSSVQTGSSRCLAR